jgi:gamma-glutamyl-gamma-aminobutyrate hydrolase PuuD
MNQTFDKIANDLDSFIITGGKDDTLREQVESHLANKMLERDKPVFGVGRGALLLAKILKADIIDVKNHTNCEHPIFYRREVRTVNSNHDTTIQQMSPGTDVLCHDYKGNIEAFINGNLAGILWNPESMTEPWIPPEIAYLLKI